MAHDTDKMFEPVLEDRLDASIWLLFSLQQHHPVVQPPLCSYKVLTGEVQTRYS
jgi:hypothetical protein